MTVKRKDKLTYATIVTAISAVLVLLSYARVFDGFERNTFDFRYRTRPAREICEDIVIIEIGDDSIHNVGQWPFTRNYHALLLRALHSAGASSVVFDIFFSEPTKHDQEFARAAADFGDVYFPYVFDINRNPPDRKKVYALGYAAATVDVLEDAARGAGFVNVIPDVDGKVRRMPLFISYEGKKYPLLSLKAAVESKGYSFADIEVLPGRYIKFPGDVRVPLDSSSYMLINYAGRWGEGFRHFSYVDIIQSYLADITGQDPVVDLSELDSAICFVGVTASASPDAHPSPMESMYPGVGVHASIYDSLMRHDFMRRLGRWPNLLILTILLGLTVYLTLKLPTRKAGAAVLGLAVFYVFLAFLTFRILGLWVDVFYPVVALVLVYFMVTFKKYIEETRKRELIEKELNIARDIQMSFLPKVMPELGGVEVSVEMITAKQVGGDLYDVFDLGEGRVGIMIGDVSGKGVPAALYMAKAASIFKTYFQDGYPSEVLRKTNDRLVAESSSGLFVTLSYMVFDTGNKNVQFALGGHLPTIMIGPDGRAELLDVSEGLPLGMLECDFSAVTREYAPGSVFVFYTDGVTEAMNVKGEMFSPERLVNFCGSLAGMSAREVVAAVHMEVSKFAGKAEQHDDITVMAVRV